MERTPVRKSPRLNKNAIYLDSPPMVPFRPTFDLHAYTPSPVRKVQGVDVLKENRQCFTISSSKSNVNKNYVNVSTESLKRKGKEIMHESLDKLPHDSDFEDDIPIIKRLRLKNDLKSSMPINLKKSVSVGGKKVSGLKGNKSRKSKGKRYNQGAKYKFQEVIFNPEELAAFDLEELFDSRRSDLHKKVNELPNNSVQHDGEDSSQFISSHHFRKLAEDVLLVLNQLKALEDKVDVQLIEMKAFMDLSFKDLITEIRSLHKVASKNKESGTQKIVGSVIVVNEKGDQNALLSPNTEAGIVNDQAIQ